MTANWLTFYETITRHISNEYLLIIELAAMAIMCVTLYRTRLMPFFAVTNPEWFMLAVALTAFVFFDSLIVVDRYFGVYTPYTYTKYVAMSRVGRLLVFGSLIYINLAVLRRIAAIKR